MFATLKSEFRKILTVRSTLAMFVVSFLLSAGLIGFWIYGFKDVENAAQNAGVIPSMIFAAASTISIFFAFMAILAFGHEYRYNTIMYTLTAANRRSKVFFAKYFALLVITFIASVLLIAATIAGFYIGAGVHGVTIKPQHIELWDLLWRATVAILGFMTFAYIIVGLLRSLVGAFAIIILMPTTIEGIATLLLKGNVKFLPFTALGNLTQQTSGVSLGFSAIVVAVYVVVFGALAYTLFLERDAN